MMAAALRAQNNKSNKVNQQNNRNLPQIPTLRMTQVGAGTPHNVA
jgi:hypothetical protein